MYSTYVTPYRGIYPLFFYEGHVGSYEWRTSTFRSVVEIMFYAFLGSIMMIAFLILFFGRETETRTKVFLIGVYLFTELPALHRPQEISEIGMQEQGNPY